MLITTCTHCLARFRVTPQQLNARQGQVRCGRCEKVFSGFEALERVPDDDTGSRLLAAREALERAAPRPSETPGEELPELEGMDAPAPIAAGEPPVPARPASRGTRRQEPVPPAAIAEPFDLEPPARRV
jgi:predicted Zn finger-like uncharacterized protein